MQPALSFDIMPKRFHHNPNQPELFTLTRDGSTKVRDIYVPTDEVRMKHEAMLRRLHALEIPFPHAHGGLPGFGVIDNVRPHQQSNYFYKLDIKNAFPSVDHEWLQRTVHDMLVERRVRKSDIRDIDHFVEADALVDGCPGLPLGYPASPFLFNIYCRPTDLAIGAGLALRKDFGYQVVRYSRWLDDLTFSSLQPIDAGHRRILREWVHMTPGFEINHRKSQRHSLGQGPVTITGISLYPDRRMAPSPELLEKVRVQFGQMAELIAAGIELTPQEIGEFNGYHSVLHMAGDPLKSRSATVRLLAKWYNRLVLQLPDMESAAPGEDGGSTD
jgi:hypothetical protein